MHIVKNYQSNEKPHASKKEDVKVFKSQAIAAAQTRIQICNSKKYYPNNA